MSSSYTCAKCQHIVAIIVLLLTTHAESYWEQQRAEGQHKKLISVLVRQVKPMSPRLCCFGLGQSLIYSQYRLSACVHALHLSRLTKRDLCLHLLLSHNLLDSKINTVLSMCQDTNLLNPVHGIVQSVVYHEESPPQYQPSYLQSKTR